MELMVVIAIIGSLSAIVLASLNESRTKGENTAIIKQVEAYITAIHLTYAPNNNSFPGNYGLNTYGCLVDTIGGANGCRYNGATIPMYPSSELAKIEKMISLQPLGVSFQDAQGDVFDAVQYSSDGNTFRIRYVLKGDRPDDDCILASATTFNQASVAFDGVTVCIYESR